MMREKTFVLLEAYDYEWNQVIARIVLHLIEDRQVAKFVVENYAAGATVLDPEYYNPFDEIDEPDYDAAYDKLAAIAANYSQHRVNSEVDVR